MPQTAAAVVNPRTAGVLTRQLPPTAKAAVPPQVFIPLHWKLAVGGVAGVVGVSTTFPIDIVKTQLQGQTRSSGKVFFSGPIHCFRHILKTDGMRGLYRGLPPTLIGVLPEKAIKLAVNEQLREYFADETGKLSLSKQVLAGAGAGLAQVIATNPTEIVKIRLQTQAALPPAERLTAVQVVQSLGVRGLYKGAGVCLMRDIPYAVIFFPMYASVKDAFTDAEGNNSIASIVFAGATAGATAAGLCTPADVIKTRRQMRGANYTSTLDCFQKVVATNGYGALMKGVVPRMMVQAPLFGITLVAFELQKNYMQSLARIPKIHICCSAPLWIPVRHEDDDDDGDDDDDDATDNRESRALTDPASALHDAQAKKKGAVAPTSIVIASVSKPPTLATSAENNAGTPRQSSRGNKISAPAFSNSFLSKIREPLPTDKGIPSAIRRQQTDIHGGFLSNAYIIGRFGIWMLGITIAIGGQYFPWNAGLAAGFYGYLIAYVLIAGTYLTLCCCTAEITGALAFAGGAYGLSRCTLGFFPGFFIGCCEALEYITYVATTTLFLADMIVKSVPSLHGYEPLIWLAFYISALWIRIVGGRVFWRFNLVLGGISFVIVLLFCFGSLPFVNWEASVARNSSAFFVDDFNGFMKALPIAAWFFVGVEALSLTSDNADKPRNNVPVAQVACVTSLMVTGIMVLCITVALPYPGEIAAEFAPLNDGIIMFSHFSEKYAMLLSVPATYATAFGFTWCYGKLIHAMATSCLLPPVLAKHSKRYGTPHVALVAGSALSYAICLVVYLHPMVGKYLFSICMTSAFLAYTGQCIGYISLKKNYKNIKSSHFQNPFGIYGAMFSMFVWLLGIASIAGFQGNSGVEIEAFGFLALSVTAFYFVYAKKRQKFSPQENKVLLVAHVIKFNATRLSGEKAIQRSEHGQWTIFPGKQKQLGDLGAKLRHQSQDDQGCCVLSVDDEWPLWSLFGDQRRRVGEQRRHSDVAPRRFFLFIFHLKNCTVHNLLYMNACGEWTRSVNCIVQANAFDYAALLSPDERNKMPKLLPMETTKSNNPKSIVVSSDAIPPPTIALNGEKFSYRAGSNANGPSVDIWMLGIIFVIGGQYFCWNAGLAVGLYSYMIAYFLIASAYITLCCCTSEITGALPFAGRAYGLARCTFGFYPAFMIGCYEVLEYIVCVSTSVLSLADMIVLAAPSLASLRPLIWVAFYILALFFHLKSDRVFWTFNVVIGTISIAIVVLFCFGGLSFASFPKYADDPVMRFVDGFAGFMKALPLASWFFVGVEALRLASDQVANPKVMIPFVQNTCILMLFVTGVMVFFVTVSLSPGIASLSSEPVPFNNCFERLFSISHNTATILSLPATGHGDVSIVAHVPLAHLASPRYPGCRHHIRLAHQLFAVSVRVPRAVHLGVSLQHLHHVRVHVVHGQRIGYISLKFNYRNIKSSNFHSPCGFPSALYSMSVWILAITAIAGYQGNGGNIHMHREMLANAGAYPLPIQTSDIIVAILHWCS
ncbi:putative transporter, partial [Globisporangium splendens]